MKIYIISILFFLYLVPNIFAQDSTYVITDSLITNTDSIIPDNSIDTLALLQNKIIVIERQIRIKDSIISNLKEKSLELNQQIINYQFTNESLQGNISSSNKKNDELQEMIKSKNELIQMQIKTLEEKERIVAEKEIIYKNAIFSRKIDSLELASLIMAKDIELEGKMKEVALLEQNISEKNSSINTTSTELQNIRLKKEKTDNELSRIKDSNTELKVEITKKGKDLEQKEQKIQFLTKDLERTKKELDNCINKDKKKKVRVVQGIAIKTFRAPQYELAPKDVNNTSVYVISNKNSGNIELDYITGTTIKIMDINPKKYKESVDFSFFIGFGGKDLFKNFYLGPNIKMFNVLHINTGINFREYEVLKSGFGEGDSMPLGTPIPTNSQWKITGYLGITLDLNVFASIAKKG